MRDIGNTMNDLIIAKRYIRLAARAEKRGIEFNLPLTSFSNLMKAKRCQITGVTLKHLADVDNDPLYITVDRIDNTKGYVKGNVIACAQAANVYKGSLEGTGLLESPYKQKVIKYYLKVLESKYV